MKGAQAAAGLTKPCGAWYGHNFSYRVSNGLFRPPYRLALKPLRAKLTRKCQRS